MSDIREKLAELDRLCEQASLAHKEAVFCYHNRKVILAKEMLKAEARGTDSAAKQERDARVAPEYMQAIVELAEAEAESFKMRGLYQNQKVMLETWRTVQANEREQLKHLKDA